MSKIIIDNRSKCSDEDALTLYERTIQQGKEFNGCYCPPRTTFEYNISVWTFENKQSVRFVVTDFNYHQGEWMDSGCNMSYS